MIADTVLHVIPLQKDGQGIANLADAVKRDAAVPPGAVLIGIAAQQFIAHAIVQIIHMEPLSQAVEPYLPPVGGILILDGRLFEGKHGAAEETVPIFALQAAQQGMCALDGRWFEDDVVIHEQDVVDTAFLDILNHGARETAAAAVIAVVDDAQGWDLLHGQGAAVIHDKDGEPPVFLLEVRQHGHGAANVFLPLEGADAHADLLVMPFTRRAMIGTREITRTDGKRLEAEPQEISICIRQFQRVLVRSPSLLSLQDVLSPAVNGQERDFKGAIKTELYRHGLQGRVLAPLLQAERVEVGTEIQHIPCLLDVEVLFSRFLGRDECIKLFHVGSIRSFS